MQLMEERTLRTNGPKASEKYLIYNGFEDFQGRYVGQDRPEWFFKKGEVSEVGPFKWKEVDQMNTSPGNVVMNLHEVEGEIVANELILKHGHDEKGIVIFHPDTPKSDVEQLKAKANEKALRYKRGRIEDFKKGRELARAGRSGFRIDPDEHVLRWIKEFGIEDEIFNPLNPAADMRDQMKEMVESATKPFAEMFERLMKPKIPAMPKRKSFESDLDYEQRVGIWRAQLPNADTLSEDNADATLSGGHAPEAAGSNAPSK
jgi:hypothetical protein